MAYHDNVTRDKRLRLQAKLDDWRAARDPDNFPYHGTQVYCGKQGSGKTISAVKHVLDIKARYPKAILVTNLRIKQLNARAFQDENSLRYTLDELSAPNDYVFFQDAEQLALALVGINNENRGVIYLIDEIHTYFNALESKNIPMYVFTEISQQRKQRKLIIGTSQLFLRMAKPLREQCDNVVMCSTVANFLTIQRVYDGMEIDQDYNGKLTGDKKRTGWFFHTRLIRQSYDTYQKVVSGQEQYDLQKPVRIEQKRKKISINM